MCLGDALDDCQAEADPRMVTAHASGAALERFGECRDQLRGELFRAYTDPALFARWVGPDVRAVPPAGIA